MSLSPMAHCNIFLPGKVSEEVNARSQAPLLAFVVPPLGGKLTGKDRLKPELQTVCYRSTLLNGSDEERGNDVKIAGA
jgi:hypothetical protein